MKDTRAEPEARTAQPRQRWRLTFARIDTEQPMAHRQLAHEWTRALAELLPLARPEGSRRRPPLTFAAPLPDGVLADAELADLYLADRLPASRVRDAVAAAAPAGIVVRSTHDVWVGAPALAATVSAADYRVGLASGGGPDCETIRDAARRLLAAATIERRRPRGDGSAVYDLRPFLAAIDVEAGPPTQLRIRTTFHPQRGAGRPEEVLAALAETIGAPLDATAITRERIMLADDEPETDGFESPGMTGACDRAFDRRRT